MKNERENLEDSIKEFFNSVVFPAFKEIKTILGQLGKKSVTDQTHENRMTIKALQNDEEDFSYSIHTTICVPNKHIDEYHAIPFAETYIVHRNISRGDRCKNIRLKKEYYTIDNISKADIVKHYKSRFMFQLKEYAF